VIVESTLSTGMEPSVRFGNEVIVGRRRHVVFIVHSESVSSKPAAGWLRAIFAMMVRRGKAMFEQPPSMILLGDYPQQVGMALAHGLRSDLQG
jgi:hypothetical protein